MLKTAARVGEMFGLDPVAVLAEENDFAWAIRVAAYTAIGADRKAAHDEQNRHRGVTGSRPKRRR